MTDFNNLSITGKVVDKPDYFDGLNTFTLFQEGTNLSILVFYESGSKLDIHIGQVVHIRGKLCYDSEEDALFLHASYIFAGEKPRKKFIKRQTNHATKSTNVEMLSSSIEEEGIPKHNVPSSEPVVTSLQEEHSVVQQENEIIQEEVQEKVQEDINIVEKTEDSEEVNLEVNLPSLSSEKDAKREDSKKEETPIVNNKPTEDNSDKPKAFRRLFNVAKDENINKPEEPVQDEIASSVQEQPVSQRKHSQSKRESRFTIDDFNC